MTTETIVEPSPQTTTNTLTLEEAVVAKVRQLSVEKQLEARDFVEFLHLRIRPKQPKKSVKGIGRHLVTQVATLNRV